LKQPAGQHFSFSKSIISAPPRQTTPPPTTLLMVAILVFPDFKVEIEAVAVVD
jgi:enamine deaminase RidA (YjgF/YER057c/UK114 family)